MGPTNVALVKLYQTELALREAQGRLDAASKNVRVQERRVSDLTEKLRVAQQQLMAQQARSGNLDLDIKSRDERIEKLRTQQANAKNNKEYQAFLVEINTEKVDKGKSEDEQMKVMETIQNDQGSIKDMTAQLEGEKGRLATMRSEITETIARLQAEVGALQPARDQASAAVPQRARQEFDRLSDRFEGEVLSALYRPDPRREEYVCSACMMDLVLDVYNRLHTRDEMVFCPSCRRMLYIPADLPPEQAVKIKKEPKAPRTPREPKSVKSTKGSASKDPNLLGAAATRQSSAVDILRSLTPEPDETPAAEQPAPPPADSTEPPVQS
ncbi:MAG TPA: C4-type zinc ribbon domain-containing protein [Tepidisphaeraceae bacterium]|nr:C4-type zinc ribbon domain-containing protein [Tepidisphaeraceae bacterium]